MPLDSVCLSAVEKELQKNLIGGRIDKIHQPMAGEITISLRTQEKAAVRLLLSANRAMPRAQITDIARENPEKAPMFCMLLRKHLGSGRLSEIIQTPQERTLRFTFETRNDFGDATTCALVLEAVPARANLILLDAENRIIDCAHHLDGAQRQLLPGLFYHPLAPQGKIDPASCPNDEFFRLFSAANPQMRADKWLLDTFAGFSPLICRELVHRTSGHTDLRMQEMDVNALYLQFSNLLTLICQQAFTPTLLYKENEPFDFSFFPITQYESMVTSVTFPSFSALFDAFCATREQNDRMRQKGQTLYRAVTTARDRTAKKLALQQSELAETAHRDQHRIMGELITANMHALSRGDSILCTTNYYDPEGGEIKIPLDPLLSPQQNAAKYFKTYQRAKTAAVILKEQIALAQDNLTYLESVLESLSRAEKEQDLQEIRQELVQTGFLRQRSKGKEKKLQSRPLTFRSRSGMRICVGRNNVQNDLLTTKLAFKSDIWFHTQKIHGAHVILFTEGQTPDKDSLVDAANLAAWYSQNKNGGKTPVDFTPVKFVKKPAGARPGMVTYTTYETAVVAPSAQDIDALRIP